MKGVEARVGVEGTSYPLVESVATELHSTVWYNPYAIAAITPHEPFQPFFTPHLCQRGRDAEFVFGAACALYLEEDFEAFEG